MSMPAMPAEEYGAQPSLDSRADTDRVTRRYSEDMFHLALDSELATAAKVSDDTTENSFGVTPSSLFDSGQA